MYVVVELQCCGLLNSHTASIIMYDDQIDSIDHMCYNSVRTTTVKNVLSACMLVRANIYILYLKKKNLLNIPDLQSYSFWMNLTETHRWK